MKEKKNMKKWLKEMKKWSDFVNRNTDYNKSLSQVRKEFFEANK